MWPLYIGLYGGVAHRRFYGLSATPDAYGRIRAPGMPSQHHLVHPGFSPSLSRCHQQAFSSAHGVLTVSILGHPKMKAQGFPSSEHCASRPPCPVKRTSLPFFPPSRAAVVVIRRRTVVCRNPSNLQVWSRTPWAPSSCPRLSFRRWPTASPHSRFRREIGRLRVVTPEVDCASRRPPSLKEPHRLARSG